MQIRQQFGLLIRGETALEVIELLNPKYALERTFRTASALGLVQQRIVRNTLMRGILGTIYGRVMRVKRLEGTLVSKQTAEYAVTVDWVSFTC